METHELLVKAGLPKDLLGDIGAVKDCPELLEIWDMITSKSNIRVIFIFGQPSPKKERICAILLKAIMEWRKKKGLWLTPIKIPTTYWSDGTSPFPPSGVTALMGVDMYSQVQIKTMVGFIRDQIPEDKVFIIDVSSEEVMTEMIGKVAMEYLRNYSMALSLVIPKATPITVSFEDLR